MKKRVAPGTKEEEARKPCPQEKYHSFTIVFLPQRIGSGNERGNQGDQSSQPIPLFFAFLLRENQTEIKKIDSRICRIGLLFTLVKSTSSMDCCCDLTVEKYWNNSGDVNRQGSAGACRSLVLLLQRTRRLLG